MTQPPIPRLRLFGGPNGSGKSTLKKMFYSGKQGLRPDHLGVYLNPDDIEKDWRTGGVNLGKYRIPPDLEPLRRFLALHPLTGRSGQTDQIASLEIQDGILGMGGLRIDSYLASALTEFFRETLLERQLSFSFESVMSSPSKLEFLAKAKAADFRTYLYFVSTLDPEINIDRVRARYATGGHNVPEDKIRSRYVRTLEQLYDAVKLVDRAYLFDNSGEESILLAEYDGENLDVKRNNAWLNKYLLNKLAGQNR